ncbi:unnamed protein product [Enterobius vermicularis]|uniref:Sorting nexin n=1 Tax=Enterobius vermicularis TaxID=51028 RepID=A0A0N4VCH9_ENTVE|nr:unnamed protein product [Enterobius vermicularis]
MQVRAVYDFEAQPHSGELSISVDEILTVIKENIEGGWLEGMNSKGQHGLFPESYVVKINPQPTTKGLFVDKLLELQNAVLSGCQSDPVATSQALDDDDFDDWTEDDEEVLLNTVFYLFFCWIGTAFTFLKFISVSLPSKASRSFLRFSNFVKSGMEGYILSTTKMTTRTDEHHEIVLTSAGPCWAPITQPYSCVVDKPKKESKLKGLKSFIAYSVTSSLSGIQVSRRYKHFDWLHEQLSAKYILTPIPPLPEKQVAGRYEEDLIEHRKNILQLWVNKICRHPVLSKSDVWIHFLTCTDEKQWKNGKRKAEKDEYVGGNFLHCVTVPTEELNTKDVERQVESFSRCVRSLEDSVRVMYDRVKDLHVRTGGPYKTSWQKLATAFAGLGHSFELDTGPVFCHRLCLKLECAQVYHKIGEQHEESSKRDIDPLMDSLYTYRGLLANMPEIVSVHKVRGIPADELEQVRQKVDSVSYAVLSEIQFQHHERAQDFNQMMGDFLHKQAAFYMNISKQLSDVAALFQSSGR